MITSLAMFAGFALDLVVGDPRRLPHPVVIMGKIIAGGERVLRKIVPSTPQGLRVGGALLAVGLCLLVFGASVATLYLCGLVSPWLRLVVEVMMCCQVLATKELWRQSVHVARTLNEKGIEQARKALGYIVGRDTKNLDEAGITRATVETVAENASDGVIAPLVFLALGGAPLGMMYKAINTMDSIIGYKNETYRSFGCFAAHLDDVANFIPARLTGLCFVVCAPLVKLSPSAAWRTMRRDAHNHASPNAGFAEAAMAGALGVQLGGGAVYQGVFVGKPTLGDARRNIERVDIARANYLMAAASICALVILVGMRLGLLFVGGGVFSG